MLLGLCTDTHDNLGVARGAVDTFESAGVDAIVHCGDVVAPFTAAEFDVGIDFHAVYGNNDGEPALADAVGEFGIHHGESAHLTFDGVDVAVYHGTSEQLVDALIGCGEYDYVVRGHTHERTHEERNGTVHVNPGGLPFPGVDDTYHVATLDTESGEVRFHAVDP